MRLLSTLQVIQAALSTLLAATAALRAQQESTPPDADEIRVTLSADEFPCHFRDRDENLQVLRVVDGVTGEPIPGAEVFRIDEGPYPLPATLEFVERVVADQDGFARTTQGGAWTMVRAPGFGPGMNMGSYDRVFPLARGLDVPVRVLDWQGLPFAGHLVGWCSGCGHTPDLQNAVTDRDGVATFRCIDPGNGISDLYMSQAPIHFDYYSLRWSPGDPPDELQFSHGAVLRGVVLESDGTPAAGAVVGTHEKHRGPWAAADANGHFTVGGLDPGNGFIVAHRGRKAEFPWPVEMPCTLRLPPPGDDPFVDGAPQPRGTEGLLRPVFAQGIRPEDTRVTVRGPLPGPWRTWGDSADDFTLVAGRYEVRVQSRDYHEQLLEVEVGGAAATELPVPMQPLPRTTLAVAGLPDDGTVRLADCDGSRDISLEVEDGTPIAVDPGRDYCVELGLGYVTRRFPMTGLALLRTDLPPFRWYGPTRITARLIDERGAPVAADLALITEIPWEAVNAGIEGFDPRAAATAPCPDGRVELTTTEERGVYLWVDPRDDGLRPRLVKVAMPPRGDAAHADLGALVLTATPALSIRAADGSPLQRPVALLRTGRADFREQRFLVFATDDDGAWLGPDLVPGDGIMVPEDDDPGPDEGGVPTVRLPFRRAITDRTPLRLQLPSARLRIEVHDEAGAPLHEVTAVLREGMWAFDGVLAVAQVPAGHHRLFLSAAGRQTAVVDLQVRPGEERQVRVVLPKR